MRKTRILVVDDEPANRTLLRKMLTPLGYELGEAEDGEGALAAVSAALPDLILLDVVMPRLDGYEVCRTLKNDPRTRLVPIILLTGLHEGDEKIKAADVGADEFVRKPFNLAELSTRVRSLLSLKFFTDELEHASNVLESVALVVESRDHYTSNHCKRLGEYARRVGGELGLSEDDLKILHMGGIFHDLGKIAVSDSVLNKPGRLTPEEWDAMKRHPLIGAELCQSMRTMQRVLPLIRSHHEKLDGSGYPDGLKGGEISTLVRITSVVDVYDALATKRSYKDSFPRAKCLEILREEAAKGWWDRDVVEALARVLA